MINIPQNQCLVNFALLESNKINSADRNNKKQIMYEEIPKPLYKKKSAN